jgi:hypothetical protein
MPHIRHAFFFYRSILDSRQKTLSILKQVRKLPSSPAEHTAFRMRDFREVDFSIAIPMRKNTSYSFGIVRAGTVLLAFLFPIFQAYAQPMPAQKLVEDVMYNELQANKTDHTKWVYRDADKRPDKNTVKVVIDAAGGSVSKTIQLNDHALTAQQQEQDREKMESIVNDPAVRAKQRKNSTHDDEQAVALMKMLPNAFIWTEAGESNGEITLHFKPNPAFQPPTYASRVFAAMAGEMVVDAAQKRLKMLSGTLIQPVEFGWGILGKMQPGGTFRIVRSEVAPNEWEITQTHVHINGHALFFKSISEQEDEITSDYKRSPAGLTLQQAAEMLTSGAAAKELQSAPEK